MTREQKWEAAQRLVDEVSNDHTEVIAVIIDVRDPGGPLVADTLGSREACADILGRLARKLLEAA